MTLKDYIGKEQLTAEEQKQLIDELYKAPEEFLSDCYIDELPSFILEIIEEKGLKDANIAYEICRKWSEDEVGGDNTEVDYKEKEYFWFLKAAELGSDSIDLDEFWIEDEKGQKEFSSFELNYYTPLVKKAEADCLNSWGCRYALGLDGEDVNYKYARKLFELSKNDESKQSLYHIYSNGLGVKKNVNKAISYVLNVPTDNPFRAFKSNISEGLKIEQPQIDEQYNKVKKLNESKSKVKESIKTIDSKMSPFGTFLVKFIDICAYIIGGLIILGFIFCFIYSLFIK